MQIKKLVFVDYYSGNHFICSASSKLYEIKITEYISHDDIKRSTTYNFSYVNSSGTKEYSLLEYPGTPQLQYYGFPRLRSGKTYILITSMEPLNNKTIKLSYGYNLFYLQTIDSTTYAYPYIYDSSMIPLSVISENIPFKYKSESTIYDSWSDADVCDWLDKYNHKNPEYQYKLLADDLIDKYRRLLYQGV